MKIYLLRHGETDWSREGRLQGHTDIPMNETGIEQINLVADFLYKSEEKVDIIITSPLQRARKSAEIIADNLGIKAEDIIIEEKFKERHFGLGEGLTLAERKAGFGDLKYPNIESVEDLCKRANTAIFKYIKEYSGKTILITAHGSILKAVLTEVTNREYNEGSIIIETGKLCLLEYSGEAFKVIYCNEVPANSKENG